MNTHPFRAPWLFSIAAVAVTMISGLRAESGPALPPLPEDLMPELKPILTAALKQSPQMITNDINLATAESIRIQWRAMLLPSVSGFVQDGKNKTAIASQTNVSSTSSGVYYSVNLSQPIFEFGARKARADAGKINVMMAQHQYADAYRLLLVNLRTQYLGLVTKKIVLRNAEYSLKQAEEALALAEESLKAGRISPEAMMEPRLAVDEARLGRDSALEDFESSKRTFLLTAGQTGLENEAVSSEVPQPVYLPEVVERLLKDFLRTGAEGTYLSLFYRDNIKSANIDYRIARVNLLPKVSFNYSYGQQNVTNASPGYISQVVINTQSYNLQAIWSIFDGFSTRGQKLGAMSRKRSNERALRTAEDQAIEQARDLAKQLNFGWRTVELRQTRWSVSNSTLQRLQDDLKLGRTSQTAVNSAQQNVYSWDLNLSYARAAYLGCWANFLSTLCADPMLDLIPQKYVKDGK